MIVSSQAPRPMHQMSNHCLGPPKQVQVFRITDSFTLDIQDAWEWPGCIALLEYAFLQPAQREPYT